MIRYAAVLVILVLPSLISAQTNETSIQTTSVSGTTWSGTIKAPNADGQFQNYDYQFDFLAGNKLRWRWFGDVFENATWFQNERLIRMELNDGYSTWLGTIEGTTMTGNSVNKLGHKWTWTLAQLTTTGTPTPQAAPEAKEWIKFSSTPGRFSILMPGEPEKSQKEIDTAAGKLTNYVFLASSELGTFIFSYADYPPNNSDPQKVLENVRQGAINGIKGTLVTGTSITHKGYPGLEFQARFESGVYNARIYLVKTRLYQMAVVAQPDKLLSAELSKYLTSFDLSSDR